MAPFPSSQPSQEYFFIKNTNGLGEGSLEIPELCNDVFDKKRDFQVIGVKEAVMKNGQHAKDKETCLTTVLIQYQNILTQRRGKHLGYPVNMDGESYVTLAPLLGFHINNIGDPFIDSNCGLHSKWFEVDVLNWFAKLWEIEKDEYWGYITNGSTEGNHHGILLGRELHPEGILYASRESHYSIFKAARMYRMKCEVVEAMVTGEIDCKDLEKKLLLNKDKPAIINVNIGTTFKGGIDDLDAVIRILEECGFSQDRFYIHCDTALSGFIVPFVKYAPKFTFKKPIGSVSISGHKFLGCPMPCGVQMTRKKYIDVISRNVEYIGSMDSTISGSRNGHTPIFMWYNLKRKGMGLQEEVKNCLENAQYLKNQLKEKGIWAMCNQLSITVVFDRPLDNEFVRSWQLSCEGKMAHVVVMPNISIQLLDAFVSELFQKKLACYKN